MARIVSFEARPRTLKIQPTEVVCYYSSSTEANGKTILQLDTHEFRSREIPGKVSQPLQPTEDQARELWNILGTTFRFK